ncbi:MAG TPA: lipopolysaccharide kinase InaA family protein [Phycisphaerae bacterium]|nr:lipopolysaccharide kinase InaA family protein [Phycisphaerae bacterium]
MFIPAIEMTSDLHAAGLRDYEDFASFRNGDLVSQSGSAETRRFCIATQAGQQHPCFFKRYAYRPPRFRTAFLEDKCSIEARNYETLRARCGVQVPDVIAFGSRRSGARLCDAFILTRAVPDAVSLDAWLAENAKMHCGEARRARARVMNQSAALVARMHAAGFFHVDLQLRNILVSTTPTADLTLYLIDSARGRLASGRIGRAYWRVRDLSSLYKGARVHLSRSELLRWLKSYLGVRRLTFSDRELVRTVWTDRRLKDRAPA